MSTPPAAWPSPPRSAAPPGPSDADPAPALPRRPLVAAWAVLWLLMAVVAVQDARRHGGSPVWMPLLWEGSSCLVATAILAWQWRTVARLDPLLDRPWAWFARALARLPLLAPAFVVAVYGLRHAVLAALGRPYLHEPWSQVFPYEMAKFAVFYGLVVAVVFGLRSHAALARQRLEAQRAVALAREAQLLQLAQQIEPHFLFNALGTIAETVHTDPALADRLLTRLAALLRAATDLGRRPEATLGEELQLARAYAEIMGERFGDRVTVTFDTAAAPDDRRLPALMLQPLLENAFRHGVERRPGPVRIDVSARTDAAGTLVVQVADDAGELPAAPRDGTGLANLRERLAARFGDAASLVVEPRSGGGVVQRIRLPAVA